MFLQNESHRSKFLVRAGLWIYDYLGGRTSLPKSKAIEFSDDQYDQYKRPLLENIKDGIIYSDCTVDDTRLVIANATCATARGAKILTYTSCDNLSLSDGKWRVSLRDMRSDDVLCINASMVVNASGPWARKFLNSVSIDEDDPDLPDIRLVKGSHVILPRQYDGDHIYVLQQNDKRIVFIAPYQDDYTLIGTTEEDHQGNPRDASISDNEMAYLCNAVNNAFTKKILPSDVLFTFSGVRPLLDDGKASSSASAVSREYMIYHHKRFDAPLLSVFGGKLTTYRALSQEVVDKFMIISGRPDIGYNSAEPLTGGNLSGKSFDEFLLHQRLKYPWLDQDLLRRYARSYGTQMDCFLANTKDLSDMGIHYGDNIFGVELDYLIKHEWASCAEDIIWRRSKLGLCISEQTLRNIEASFSENGEHLT